MKILVTGSAGFIGFHLTGLLLKAGFEVVGLDIINDYYDVRLKYARLSEHGIDGIKMKEGDTLTSAKYPKYRFLKADVANHDFLVNWMVIEKFDFVVHLAAQAGVRYSLTHPRAYTHSNIDGFLSILEGCRHGSVKHLVYASSSSVYGLNTSMPLSEAQPTEHPISLYAATKKANEIMAHTYSHLFNLPTTGLRFFTVYGPWGRPDMALFLFTEAILTNQPIKLFNNGSMVRDFTYVDDIVESIRRILFQPAQPDPTWNSYQPATARSSAPYRIFNIGNSNPVELKLYIASLEKALGKETKKEYLPMQLGDVPATHADVSELVAEIDFRPTTTVEEGIKRFVSWYSKFYKL